MDLHGESFILSHCMIKIMTLLELSLSNSSPYAESLSLYAVGQQLPWRRSILLFLVSLWHIWTNRKKLNRDMKMAFSKRYCFGVSIYGISGSKSFIWGQSKQPEP